jgi:hypothetical protein
MVFIRDSKDQSVSGTVIPINSGLRIAEQSVSATTLVSAEQTVPTARWVANPTPG